MKLFVDFWKFTKFWKGLQRRNKELFLFWRLDVHNNFMFPTRKNSQKRVKIQKSPDNHSSFDGIIQENIDLLTFIILYQFCLIFIKLYQ